MSREDTHSTTEAGAAYAERMRAQSTGEDREVDEFASPRSTWDPAKVPPHIVAQARREASQSEPPF